MDSFLVHTVVNVKVRNLKEGEVKGVRFGGWSCPRKTAKASM